MKRRNPGNRIVEKGLEKFKEFHDFDAKSIGEFPTSMKIPQYGYKVGQAAYVTYKSNKWGETADYIHEHDKGVHVYMKTKNEGGIYSPIPKYVYSVPVLVKLGKCHGYAWWENQEDTATMPAGGELYCTPDGRALIVIKNKSQIEAIIFGGKLGVKDVGIVH